VVVYYVKGMDIGYERTNQLRDRFVSVELGAFMAEVVVDYRRASTWLSANNYRQLGRRGFLNLSQGGGGRLMPVDIKSTRVMIGK